MNTLTRSLVNSAHGIYAAKVLAETYELFFENNRIVDSSVKIKDSYFTPLKDCIENSFDGFEEESVERMFDPENEFFCENVDFIQGGFCRVKINDEMWSVDTFDGEFFAIHPNAVWCSEKEEYTLKQA